MGGLAVLEADLELDLKLDLKLDPLTFFGQAVLGDPMKA